MNSQQDIKENYWTAELLLPSHTHLLLQDSYSDLMLLKEENWGVTACNTIYSAE